MMLYLIAGQSWAVDPTLTAHEWLEKMSRAAHKLNYEGTFVYLHDGQMTAMRISHTVDDQGEYDHLVSLTGSGREVTLKNSLNSFLPGKSLVNAEDKASQSFPETLFHSGKHLENYYDFTLLDKQRVAGRLTQRINVKPKDNFRYGYRLWLDDASGLLLKADMVNERSVPVEQIMFTEINIGDTKNSRTDSSAMESTFLETEADKDSVEKTETGLSEKETFSPKNSGKVSDSEWRITKFPSGFRAVERNKYIMSPSHTPVEHIVLTDGLASVSIFIEKSNPKDKFSGTSHRGAVNAYGRIHNGHQITLVGEVPVATVQYIGQSIKHEVTHD